MVKRIIFLSFFLLASTSLCAADENPLRDPLRPRGFQGTTSAKAPATQPAVKTAEWRLGAVLLSAERSVAVINGQSLQVGDLLEGYKLVSIEADQVLLQKKRKKLVLHRAGTGFKKVLSSESVVKGSQP